MSQGVLFLEGTRTSSEPLSCLYGGRNASVPLDLYSVLNVATQKASYGHVYCCPIAGGSLRVIHALSDEAKRKSASAQSKLLKHFGLRGMKQVFDPASEREILDLLATHKDNFASRGDLLPSHCPALPAVLRKSAPTNKRNLGGMSSFKLSGPDPVLGNPKSLTPKKARKALAPIQAPPCPPPIVACGSTSNNNSSFNGAPSSHEELISRSVGDNAAPVPIEPFHDSISADEFDIDTFFAELASDSLYQQ